MTREKDRSRRAKSGEDEPELPFEWQKVQSAIWLIGLAILFWRGWWWPGILILMAISGLFQAVVVGYLNRREEQQAQSVEAGRLAQERAAWLPSVCPNCGGPISVAGVRWTGPNTADCPYCNANLKP
jgi:hypothetical protein